jgi:hypothetical protein
MANAPAKACKRCKKRTTNRQGWCDSCQIRFDSRKKTDTKKYYRKRGTTTERGYGSDWQRVRAEKLETDPLCECSRCREMQRVKMATIVHHIKEVEDFPDLRLVWDNLMGFNKKCHEVEHGRAKDQQYNDWRK